MELFGFDIRKKAIKQPVNNGLSPNQLYEMLYKAISNFPLQTYSGLQDTVNKAYLVNEKVYAIIGKILAANKGVPFEVYEVKDEKKFKRYNAMQSKDYRVDLALQMKSETLEEIQVQGLSDVLKKPNSYQSAEELEEDLSGFLLLTGNAYMYGGVRRGTPNAPSLELYSMPAHLTSIVFGNWMNPIRGYKIPHYGLEEISANDIGHLKYWNPDYSSPGSNLYGMPPIRAAWKLVQSDVESLNSQLNAFYNQGARGFIHPKEGGSWTQAQAEYTKEKWEAAKGTDKSGSFVFTGVPVGFTQVGLSPVDLGIMAIRGTTLRDLCSVFKVPSQLFNDTSASTYNNMKEARKALITDAALPLKEQIKGLYNRFLIPQWEKETGKRLYIDYDLSAYTELTDDLDSLFNRANNSQFISINEKREMTGFEVIENPILDEPFMPMGVIPLNEMTPPEEIDNNGGVSILQDSNIQSTALNGAQISSLLEIINSMTSEQISIETGRAMIEAAFPNIDSSIIDRIIAGARNFKPKPIE